MSSQEFKLIMERLDRIEESLSARDPILTVKDIAEMLGKSPSYIRGDGRWMLPNYGKSEFSGKILRWKKSTFENWRASKGF